MAVITRNTLVLRGVTVAGRVVTGWTRIGAYLVDGQAPALHFSMRHPSSGYPESNPEAVRQRCLDEDDADVRAGRPGSRAGVPSRRSPASSAGGTVRLGRVPAKGGPKLSAAWRLCRSSAKASVAAGKANPKRPNASFDRASLAGGRRRPAACARAGQRPLAALSEFLLGGRN